MSNPFSPSSKYQPGKTNEGEIIILLQHDQLVENSIIWVGHNINKKLESIVLNFIEYPTSKSKVKYLS